MFVVLLLDKISEEWGAVDSLTEIRLDFDKCKYEIKSSRPISLPSPLTHIHMEIMQINDNLSILQKGVREAPNNYHLQGYFKNWWSKSLNPACVLGFCREFFCYRDITGKELEPFLSKIPIGERNNAELNCFNANDDHWE